MMSSHAAKQTVLVLALVPALMLGSGCETKGPAERAGENLDQGLHNVKETVNPSGPGEKAGEAVDKALGR